MTEYMETYRCGDLEEIALIGNVVVKCNMKTEVEQSGQNRADEAMFLMSLCPSPRVDNAVVGRGQTASQLGEREA
jgi:hypothetical protein